MPNIINMNESIIKSLEKLESYRDKHYQAAKILFPPGVETFYYLDYLYIAVLNRSYCLLRGFRDLVASENLLAAAPLVRLQLDNCLRLNAVNLVVDQADFVKELLGGKRIDKMTDAAGRRMTDRYLCDQLAEIYPWVRNVYEETSGFIHLSEKHIFSAMTVNSTEEHIAIRISDRDKFVPDEAYDEAIDIFLALTDLILDLILSWGAEKSNL